LTHKQVGPTLTETLIGAYAPKPETREVYHDKHLPETDSASRVYPEQVTYYLPGYRKKLARKVAGLCALALAIIAAACVMLTLGLI
jgi:hypothetical protein